ncbi:hypothetical protein C2E23DRAFT_860762 [Lenzites betulinus]|nr:hypothetical protein C2E23DRAFT_860762 [Lenzites betulinus]
MTITRKQANRRANQPTVSPIRDTEEDDVREALDNQEEPEGAASQPPEDIAADNRPSLSPLSDPPEEDAPEGQSSQRDVSPPSPLINSERASSRPDGNNFIDEVIGIVDRASSRYAAVHDQLVDCINTQEELSTRFNNLRKTTLNQQLRLEKAMTRIKERYPSKPRRSMTQVTSPNASQAHGHRQGVYADPDDVLERSRNVLFREREDDERRIAVITTDDRPEVAGQGLQRQEATRSPTYLRESEYPTTDRWGDPNAEYIESQLRHIRRMIRDCVDRDPEDLAALKNVKGIPTPDKYDGKDDTELFLSWLKLMLRWMELSRITGTGLDTARTNLLGQYLTGAASEWYDEVVDNTHITGRIWMFEDAVCAMFKRFIHRSTARLAAEKFHAARYHKEAGVHGLWEYLIKWSLKMPRQPDDYTFNRRFIDALPEELYVPMLTNRNVSVEKTPPGLLKAAALDQEMSNRVVEEQRAAHRRHTPREDQRNSSARTSTPTTNHGKTQSSHPQPLL